MLIGVLAWGVYDFVGDKLAQVAGGKLQVKTG